MRQRATRRKLEVGDGSLPEFEGMKKGGCRKLGGAADDKLIIRPRYPANISRRRQRVGDDDTGLLGTGAKKPKKPKKPKVVGSIEENEEEEREKRRQKQRRRQEARIGRKNDDRKPCLKRVINV